VLVRGRLWVTQGDRLRDLGESRVTAEVLQKAESTGVAGPSGSFRDNPSSSSTAVREVSSK